MSALEIYSLPDSRLPFGITKGVGVKPWVITGDTLETAAIKIANVGNRKDRIASLAAALPPEEMGLISACGDLEYEIRTNRIFMFEVGVAWANRAASAEGYQLVRELFLNATSRLIKDYNFAVSFAPDTVSLHDEAIGSPAPPKEMLKLFKNN